MSLEHRVRKLEDETGGEVVLSCKFIFGGVSFHDCKRHQDGKCQRIEKSEPTRYPAGVKRKFVFSGTIEANPCDECADFEKEGGQPK